MFKNLNVIDIQVDTITTEEKIPTKIVMKEITCINSKIGMTILFWLLSLVLIPVFAYMWMLPITFLSWLIFRVIGDSHADIILWITQIVTLLLGVITVIWLWKQYKKHFVEPATSQKVADSD